MTKIKRHQKQLIAIGVVAKEYERQTHEPLDLTQVGEVTIDEHLALIPYRMGSVDILAQVDWTRQHFIKSIEL